MGITELEAAELAAPCASAHVGASARQVLVDAEVLLVATSYCHEASRSLAQARCPMPRPSGCRSCGSQGLGIARSVKMLAQGKASKVRHIDHTGTDGSMATVPPRALNLKSLGYMGCSLPSMSLS